MGWELVVSVQLIFLFLVGSITSQSGVSNYDNDDYSGDYEGSSSGDYNYSYSYEDYSTNDIENGLDRDSDESEVLYVPQMLSEPLQLNVSIGENVELPCFAKDSNEFVRIWMKGTDFLFTGGIQSTDNPRLHLPMETTLQIENAQPEDAGDYTCRIMLRDEIRVTHTLQVMEHFTVSPIPSNGSLVGSVGQPLTLKCQVLGKEGHALAQNIIWRREGYNFSNGNHTFQGGEYPIQNASREDAGMYFCSLESEGEIKLASIQVQIEFPPKIMSIDKALIRTGWGKAFELSCVIIGEPSPKITWYKGNEVVELDDRVKATNAGSKYVLILEKVHNDDIGRYMCYATNHLGSSQRTLEVHLDDIETDRIDLDNEKIPLDDADPKMDAFQDSWTEEKLKLDQLRSTLMDEIQTMRNVSFRVGQTQDPDTIDLSVFADLERLQAEISRLQDSYQQDMKVLRQFRLTSKDETQRVWDNINELQEITNVTSKNVEDIYEKDILQLQNFQSSTKSDLQNLRSNVNELSQNVDSKLGLVKSLSSNEAFQNQIHAFSKDLTIASNHLQKLESSNKIMKEEIQRIFGDVDTFKKFKQESERAQEVFQRELNQLESGKIIDLLNQIKQNDRSFEELFDHRDKVELAIEKITNKGDQKFTAILTEIQKLKGQMYYLQQRLIQRRLNQNNGSRITDGESSNDPNVNLLAQELAKLRKEMQKLVKEMTNKEILIQSQLNSHDDRIDFIHETSNSQRQEWEQVEDKWAKLDQRLDVIEADAKKYNLIFRGLKPRQKLERPFHVEELVSEYMTSTLDLDNVAFDEASRLTRSKMNPKPVLVKFPNIREKIRVLNRSRRFRSSVDIQEDFTDKVKLHRRRLSAFARRRARVVRKKWALKYDELYFNGKVFVFDDFSQRVVAKSILDSNGQ
ncbi:hypothetical protein TCAL_01222 [Tigriopus californicus]|uniref:Ig-like domain-containing protein n=1 Tax=Tigriopus californicus TaxID=6832 RepID=A0A553NXJ6_TIGCA|nr:hypothetical protein TCAL_01222 [Tigriopus californicus]